MNIDLDKLIIIGDRVLIQPIGGADKTKSGLYLPAGYKDKEEIQKGYILKILGTLGVQWLRICLLMQGTQV